MRARIETIPTEEMHKKDEEGRTTFATAIVADAPVELLVSIVELDKQDTKERGVSLVCDREGYFPLLLAAKHHTDAASIKLLARETPEALYNALKFALEYNKKSTK